MHRRTFLTAAAASPLVFGLNELFSQDKKKPEWWEAALKRMKETRRCGLVIVAPAREEQRIEVGERLLALIEGKDRDVRTTLVEAVVICLRSELAAMLLGDIKEHAVVLDSDGRKIAEGALSPDDMKKPETFVAGVRKALHGAKGERLREAVERAKKALPDADRAKVEKAVEDLDTDAAAPAGALEALKARADGIAPVLAFAARDAVFAPARERFRSMLLELYDRLASNKPGPVLAYGAQLKQGAVVKEDPCPACGMGEAPARSRRFLDFLGE